MSVLRLLPALRACGVDGDVSVPAAGAMLARFAQEGIAVHTLSGGSDGASLGRALVRLLRTEAYDAIHLYGFRMSLVGRFAAIAARPRPVVIHGIRGLHLTDDEDADGPRARAALALERLLGYWVDHYVANSQSAVEMLARRGLPDGKFTVIPNGIDADEWTVPANPAADRRRVLCVANFRPVKRITLLLDALGVLASRGIPAHCTLAGDGPMRPALEARVERLGLRGRVTFAGRLPSEAIRELLGSATVLVLPSRWEGMPVSIMEAMAAGVPVVACDVPGVRDLVEDGVTGTLVGGSDPHALADALARLFDNPGELGRLGAAGRARVRRDYTLELQAERHAATYRRLLACSRSRR
jgi:glycosyltransferase involved in cell wall biosynthesis